MSPPAGLRQPSDLVVIHSSDLHVDDGYTARAWNGDGTGPLAAVIDTARHIGANIILLTGDIFEHNRLPLDLLQQATRLLDDAPCPVVMLPGNHDPLTTDSVWYRGGFITLDDVFVLGADSDTVLFPELGLQIWGRAHMHYGDMSPLASPDDRNAPCYIVAGHGHFTEEIPSDDQLAPSWLITGDQIEATEADYVALGHWNRAVHVGNGVVPAHYSGSPDLAKTVNVVRMAIGGTIDVSRQPLSRHHVSG